MAMSTGGKGVQSELNVTPLIDILLVAILLPSLSNARDQTKVIKCASQLSMFGKAFNFRDMQRFIGEYQAAEGRLVPNPYDRESPSVRRGKLIYEAGKLAKNVLCLAVGAGDLFPDWRGDLFIGALVAREVRRLEIDAGRPVREQALFGEVEARVRDVRFGPDGAVYLLLPDRIVRVTPAGNDFAYEFSGALGTDADRLV